MTRGSERGGVGVTRDWARVRGWRSDNGSDKREGVRGRGSESGGGVRVRGRR